MIGIRLGNLTVEDLERDLEIKFSDEDREYLKSTRQENVSKKLSAEAWHYFDLPRTLSFGSVRFAMKIAKLIKSYHPQKSMTYDYQIDEETETPKSFYNLETESGYPRFLFSVSKYLPIDAFNHYTYFQLVRENSKSLTYRMISVVQFEKTMLDFDQFLLHDTIVPDEDNFLYQEIRISKEIFENPPKDNIVYAGYRNHGSYVDKETLTYLKPWHGEIYQDSIDRENEQSFIRKMNNYKQHMKDLRKNKR